MELKRRVTTADIESEHPCFLDESHFTVSHHHWLAGRDEWLEFVALIQDGDVLWEYEDICIDLGFESGEGGFLIKRGDTIVERFPTYAVG